MVAYLGSHFYSHQWHHSEKLLVHSCPKNKEQNPAVVASNLQNTLNSSDLQTSSTAEVLRGPCNWGPGLLSHVFWHVHVWCGAGTRSHEVASLHLQSTGHQTWCFARGWWDCRRTPGFPSSTTPLWSYGRSLGKQRVLHRAVKIVGKQNR